MSLKVLITLLQHIYQHFVLDYSSNKTQHPTSHLLGEASFSFTHTHAYILQNMYILDKWIT